MFRSQPCDQLKIPPGIIPLIRCFHPWRIVDNRVVDFLNQRGADSALLRSKERNPAIWITCFQRADCRRGHQHITNCVQTDAKQIACLFPTFTAGKHLLRPGWIQILRRRLEVHFTNSINDAGCGSIFEVGQKFNAAAQAFHQIRFRKRFAGVISAFHKNIGTHNLNERRRSIFRKGHQNIHTAEGRKNLEAILQLVDRASGSFQTSDTFVGIYGNNQNVTKGLCAAQIGDVAAMQ